MISQKLKCTKYGIEKQDLLFVQVKTIVNQFIKLNLAARRKQKLIGNLKTFFFFSQLSCNRRY